MVEQAFTPEWLRQEGFMGFHQIRAIREGTERVPASPGVYMVLRKDLEPPEFLNRSTGGWFKGKDPSVPIDTLRAKWVDQAHVLYLGKADAGKQGTRGIKARLGEYLRFGQSEPIGHWGGRYLWHISNSEELLVCWKPCPNPLAEEARLLYLFRSQFEVLPFANLKGGAQ